MKTSAGDKIAGGTYQIKKAISWVIHPADGLGSSRLPEASDGDGYNDPDNNDYVVEINDGKGRGNSACEAVEHYQKFQFTSKVFEMQVLVHIKDIYDWMFWRRTRPEVVAFGQPAWVMMRRQRFSVMGQVAQPWVFGKGA